MPKIEINDLKDHELWAVAYTPHGYGRTFARAYKHRRNAVEAFERAKASPKYARYTIELVHTRIDWSIQDRRPPVDPAYEVIQ